MPTPIFRDEVRAMVQQGAQLVEVLWAVAVEKVAAGALNTLGTANCPIDGTFPTIIPY